MTANKSPAESSSPGTTTRTSGSNSSSWWSSAARRTSSALTDSAAFRRLSRWAFGVCDADGTGRIGRPELYAGVLLVHVNLAKYAGAAACYPPTRSVVDDLFTASDADGSGYIEETEFMEIIRVCSVDIASRIVVYYAILILLVPYLADGVVYVLWHVDDRWMGWGDSQVLQDNAVLQFLQSFVSWKEMTDRVVSMALFFFVIPMLFDAIDKGSKNRARKAKSP